MKGMSFILNFVMELRQREGMGSVLDTGQNFLNGNKKPLERGHS